MMGGATAVIGRYDWAQGGNGGDENATLMLHKEKCLGLEMKKCPGLTKAAQ